MLHLKYSMCQDFAKETLLLGSNKLKLNPPQPQFGPNELILFSTQIRENTLFTNFLCIWHILFETTESTIWNR